MEIGTSSAPGFVAAPLPDRLEKYGRYYLVDRLATGGMAEVYRAVTRGVEGFRRTFVVKRILSEKAASPTFIRMFCDEARISALLNHPNIVQVYDFGHVSGTYFLAMEYLVGKDVSSVMRVLRAAKVAVPPAIAAFIAREAAIGLHHAHTLRGTNGQPLGIVHRDVTPSNIMLLYAGGVKLLDFGIAKVGAAAAGARDGDGGVKGKFGYLSPEQARAVVDLDGRTDVFALGVTLWEMLVGRRLFAGKDEVETLRNVLTKPVPKPSSLRPEIPAELDAIVLRALERDRDARYPTAEAMALECDRVLREARCDSQTLRAFLNDLFAEESSSLSFEMPELPESLFSAAVSGPFPLDGLPRNEKASGEFSRRSVEIEVIEPSGPQPRVRTPAPPFGVIAADAQKGASRRRSRRVLTIGAAAVAVAVLSVVAAVSLGDRP
jgi:serine/threonine protein kinase